MHKRQEYNSRTRKLMQSAVYHAGISKVVGFDLFMGRMALSQVEIAIRNITSDMRGMAYSWGKTCIHTHIPSHANEASDTALAACLRTFVCGTCVCVCMF
jgi:hypothetical protein